MYNIKVEELKKLTDDFTFEKGETLVKRHFFPFSYIEEEENPSRYDTRVYRVYWKLKSSFWPNSTWIEVDIDDNIVNYFSDCHCRKYHHMCEHLVCLGLTIPKLLENRKNKLGEAKYQEYEQSLITRFQNRKEEFLEKERLRKIAENKEKFSELLSDFKQIYQNVPLSNKVGIEIHINSTDNNNYILSLKVGINRSYVVKDIAFFLNAIKNKRSIKYGKYLEFYHDLNNFNEPAKKVLSILLTRTNYWSEELHPMYFGTKERNLLIDNTLLCDILSVYSNNYIYLDSLKPVYISDEVVVGRLFVDEEKITLKNLQNYRLFIGETKHFILLDDVIHPLKGVTETLKPIFQKLSDANELIIKDSLSEFLDEIYLFIYDEVDVDESFKEQYPVRDVKIDSYFDYDSGTLKLNTKYYLGNTESNLESLKATTYSYAKIKKYQYFIDSLGFNNHELDEIDKVVMFLKADLSPLKELGDVYLSESLKNAQIKKMNKPVVKLGFNVDLLSICFDKLEYSDDELSQIINAYKKKKKYIKLKNNVIIDLEDENTSAFVNIVDEFDLDEKHLSEKQEKPFYLAGKAFNNEDKDTYEFDERLKEIITKIKNYKENDYQVPSYLIPHLRNYQIEGFKWLKTLTEYNLGGILADDMGLGKTLQIIALIVSDDNPCPSLIICPTSLIYNWQAEIKKWTKDIPYTIVNGNVSERHEKILDINYHEKRIYITSYDTYKNDVHVYKDDKFRFVILDEAQYIKNYYTQKAKAVKQVNSEVRFVLTGTPIENSLLDLWSIFDFLLPGYLRSHNKFKAKYESAIQSDNDELLNALIKKITPFVLRRTKKGVLKELPEKVETIIYANMEDEQRKIYESILLSTKRQLEERKSKFEILSALTRLRQACVHPGMFIENYHGESAKVNMAIDLIEQSIANDHKLLVFTQFTTLFPFLEAKLREKKIKYFILQGSTKAIDRIKMVDQFNEEDDVKVFLISLKAGGTGLNLIGADFVIHIDPWWNVSVENQATDRAHRIGQKRSVNVIKLVCDNSIEQKVIELQMLKKELSDKVITDDEGNLQNLDEKDLKFILS